MNPVWHFVDGVPQVGPLTIGTAAVTSTVPLAVTAGTKTAPGIYGVGDPTTGLSGAGTGFATLVYGYASAAKFWVSGAAGSVALSSDFALGWQSGTDVLVGGQDTILSRGAADRLDLASGDSFRLVLGTADYANANGQLFSAVKQLTELTTIAAAATTDTTIQMPATAVVLAVSVRVTTIIPTAATFTVGDSGSAARFSTAAVTVAAGSTDAGTKAGAYYNAAALSIRITPNLTPADNSGRVRVTIYYYSVTPPTS